MQTRCPECGLMYDDTYRLTFCPHARFDMNCTVASGGRLIGVAHSVDELNRMLEEAKRNPDG